MRFVDAWTTAAAASALAATSIVPAQVPTFGPAPSSVEEIELRRRVEAALIAYWQGRDGFASSERDEEAVARASGAFGSTYGECTADGARAVFHALALDRGSVFCDLGSGVGKMTVQAYLEHPIARAIGVELSEVRHRRAVEAWSVLSASGDFGEKPADGLEFRCEDVMQTDLADVTHAYVANLCFDRSFNARLERRLASFPALRRVATLKELPGDSFQPSGAELALMGGSTFRPLGKFRARMTWNPAIGGTDVFLYGR